ncbi:MAG: site-2 protease family protein [Candidatus Thermoplasmatota archaeon]|nr:site-2 protease family protein [Candidatus Thermoplasmatota archaeon]
MSPLLIALVLILAWIGVLLAVYRWENKAVSLWGPTVMWKTERGKRFISRVAQRDRFWNRYADVGIVLSLAAMGAMFILILWNVYLTFQIPPEQAPSPQMLLGLPGINPVIPIGYGITALVIAIVVHELSHGILAMAGRLKVKALGVIFFIVPIGAFVEPDEEELENTSARKRSRVFAAGPTTNMVLALVCLLVLAFVLAPSISPHSDGVIVSNDYDQLEPWTVIAAANGTAVANRSAFTDVTDGFTPGGSYPLQVASNGNLSMQQVRYGLYIRHVEDGTPAASALREGDIMWRLRYDGTDIPVATQEAFIDLMENTSAGDVMHVTFQRNGTERNASVVLADKADFTDDGDDEGVGYLGVVAYGVADVIRGTGYYPRILQPFEGSFLPYLALPFIGLSPFPGQLASIYTPSDGFWMVYNMLYWIFWLNFALGTFNVLPAVPLDGGYIFRDGLASVMRRLGMDSQERREKIASRVTTAFSVVVLAAILSMILVPQLRGLLL